MANKYCNHVIKLEKCYLVIKNPEVFNNEDEY